MQSLDVAICQPFKSAYNKSIKTQVNKSAPKTNDLPHIASCE